MKNKKRSPFFYVGDKYKLMPQLIKLFPENINNYYEPFVGGGSSALYVDAKKYVLNDINKHIILLHSYKRALEKRKTVPTKLSESIEQLENFFLSDYFSLLTKLSGAFLIDRIKTECEEKAAKAKRIKKMVRV